MMAEVLDIDVPRNGHYFQEWQMLDSDGDAIDITGHTITMKATAVPGGSNVATATIAVLEATAGRISVKWTGSDFDSFGNVYQISRAAYDLKDVYPDGTINVPVRGALNVIPESTP